MGTNTKTTRDTKAEAEVEKVARCITSAKKLAKKYMLDDFANIWKCIDYTSEMIVLQHLTTYEVGKVWKQAFDVDNDNGENNNMASVCSRLAIVGMFFSLKNQRATELYSKWKNKCTIHAIYYKVRDIEKKAIKRIEKKEAITKEQLEKDAEEGVANAEEYASNIVKPNKRKTDNKEESKSWNKSEKYDSDKETYQALLSMLKGEPIVFYRMVIKLVGVNLLSEDWEKLALEEMEKIV